LQHTEGDENSLVPLAQKRLFRCSNCKMSGHTKISCPLKVDQRGDDADDSAAATSARPRTGRVQTQEEKDSESDCSGNSNDLSVEGSVEGPNLVESSYSDSDEDILQINDTFDGP
jgi:hypothetical protein